MESSFDPHDIEQQTYRKWEESGSFEPKGNGRPYCIVIPPPNVTGQLHMGHAFQHTIMDALIRYERMKGARALWQMGTDHAGIATQIVVEQKLLGEGTSREGVGREAFEERVWQWREESGGTIERQLRRMGSSLDWSRNRFTLDEGFSRAVIEVFVRLYDEGLIYRGKRLVNWDPEMETAISDLEVESSEEKGHLWHFRYPLLDGARTADGNDYLVVATTRPETMLGDTAVAVHPEDERYAGLAGARIRLPLAEREIPVIADTYVDREFGTGCVKITPAHDFNDAEVGARHNLPVINIFTSRAMINDAAPAAYRGLSRETARKQIVQDLDALGLLDQVQDHTLMVPRGERSKAVVEPFLTDQWFVAIDTLAKPAIEVVERGEIEFVPKQYENVYFAWMRDIKDWCISRQLWWGHRIPAWYDPDGNIHVARTEAEARQRAGLGPEVPLTQDPDVLDTWFSSGLWTFGTLGWPDETPELELYHPTNVLVTGHDIIFFWVARMIMLTLHFLGEVPFRKVYVHGLVRDSEGFKMSKSRGNGLDPLDLIDGVTLDELVAKRTADLMQPNMAKRIEQATRREFPEGIHSYGTDALRFTFCALASTGRDVKFDLNRIEGYRNFCNKLWNAARYVLMNTEGVDIDARPEPTLVDRWILSRAAQLLDDCERALATYRFDLYANHLYEFIWREYCDWYLEFTKDVLWDKETAPAPAASAQRTLLVVLETLLRAAHPVMPFITENIWLQVAPRLGLTGRTIMDQPWPQPDADDRNPEAERDIDWLKGVISAVRNIRGEQNLKPAQEIQLLLEGGTAEDRERLTATKALLMRLAKIGAVAWVDGDAPSLVATQLAGDLKVMVPLAGLIDLDAEKARLDKEAERKATEIGRLEGKLGNADFVAKAPAAVVAKERDKLRDAQAALAVLRDQRAALERA